MGGNRPEEMLAAALRAQAGTAPRDTAQVGPPGPGIRPEQRRVGTAWILLLALVLGLLGGVIAGYLSIV